MRFWLIIACCLLASGVFSRSLPEVTDSGEKRAEICQDGCNPSAEDSSVPDDEDDDEPKRLVVYYNFEKVMKHGRISDKSGYENSGTLGVGGEILKFNDKDYTCNQAARLWDHDIVLRGDTFQAKPKYGITIAAWLKLEEKSGQHSIFDTIGSTHTQGQFHFEVNDGVVRWFHRDEKQKVVFETMAHTVPRGVWTHVAGTYDAKTKQAKIFINGEIRNQSLGEGMLSRDWGVRAGIGNKEKHRPLRGSIDEFRIYNYALKNDEIKALVTACKNGGSDATGATAEGGNQPEASAAVNGGGAGSPGGVGGDGGTDQAASTRTLAPTETKEKEADGIKDIKGGLYSKRTNVPSESNKEPADLVATAGPQENAESEEEEEEEESKRLVVYLNFENETKIGRGKIIDKSGYENYGRMSSGGELLKFHDPGFLCNQGARLWDSEITFEGSNFQAKPKRAITVSAWIKLEEITGFHSIFDTIGKSHIHGQYHFEVNHGTIRWFHRNEYTRVVFEAMGHKVLRDKWTHVAGTYDSKTRQAKIYINGEIRNQSIGAGKLSRDWDVRVGISNPSKHRPLKGAIDEFRIYNNALNGDEIQSLVKVCKNIDTSEKGESKDRTPKVSKELLTNENKELATNENKEMTANENKEPKTKTEIEGKESTSKPADKKSNMQKNKKIKANKSKKRNIFLKKDRFNKQKKND